MTNTNDYVFGANILDNLTTGMYRNSRVIYREYIQNACDSIDEAERRGILQPEKGTVDIYVNDKTRGIEILDNGIGISAKDFQRTLGNIADSDKTLGETKGFRGIGRLCGLAYCKKLVFSSKAKGETTVSIMTCDAERMRQLIHENQSDSTVKYTAIHVLNATTGFSSEESKDKDDHWFKVELIDVTDENHELLDIESIIDYLSFVAPVPFNSNFTFRKRILEYAKDIGGVPDQYTIKINGEQIFKDYRTHVKTSKGDDDISDIQFHEIYDDDHNIIAWIWYGLRSFQAVIEAACPSRGLRLRKDNFQIGGEDTLLNFFKEPRGNHYFIGEVHAISKDLIPNSQRDYFNENQMRNVFEREISQYFRDELHPLYHVGNETSSQCDKIQRYREISADYKNKELNGDFIDNSQKKEAKEKVEVAKAQAEEGQRKIDKIVEKYRGDEESPINKVVSRILNKRRKEHNIDDNIEKINPKEEADIVSDEDERQISRKKQKHWVDRLSSVSLKDRKLISRICRIISECVDEKTMEIIKLSLEEEFK
ncbi:MAG: ATP-binding protein [Thermoguttaceae bacterium]|nr:ATP-binding protein [Thermoguttaceae bacterium]